jgi:hypothetical protein
MRAALAELDQGKFTEGHELDRKMRVPKEMVGRRLSQEKANRLLAKFARRTMIRRAFLLLYATLLFGVLLVIYI